MFSAEAGTRIAVGRAQGPLPQDSRLGGESGQPLGKKPSFFHSKSAKVTPPLGRDSGMPFPGCQHPLLGSAALFLSLPLKDFLLQCQASYVHFKKS